jgi:hypothetical protein
MRSFLVARTIAVCRLVSRCAQLRSLKDSPEPKLPGQPYGLMADNEKAAELGQLSGPITKAVVKDFRQNYVFQQIDTHVDRPDAILTGTINTLYETYRPMGWTQVHRCRAGDPWRCYSMRIHTWAPRRSFWI